MKALEFLEADPLPKACQNCQEEGWGCDECDHLGERFYLPKEQELWLSRKGLLHSIERTRKKIIEIDIQLVPFTEEQKKVLRKVSEMTYDMFIECLVLCFKTDNLEVIQDIEDRFPELLKESYRRSRENPETMKSWEQIQMNNKEHF